MRSILIALPLLAACSEGGTFLNLPANAITSPTENAIYQQRRGAVELIVKSQFDAVLSDIQSGGGPVLTQAFDAAGVPDQDRATRAFQLNKDIGLYTGNPGALVTAIMVYAST